MYFREKVEAVMIKNLCRKKKTDREVSDQEYLELMVRIENIIDYFAKERKVQGFTPEDMESFMGLKVHQILRRNLYDQNRGYYKFFNKVFYHLINDINKCKNNHLKECDEDAIDNNLTFDDRKGSKQ